MVSENLKKEVIRKYGGACAICGRKDVPLEIDHIIPRVANGTDKLENLRVVCRSCHLMAHEPGQRMRKMKDQARGGYKLEQLVVEILRAKGFAVVSGATGPDAGIDVIAHGLESDTNKPISLLIECKHRRSPISTNEIASFAAKLRNYGSRYGIIVSNTKPSLSSRKVAKSFGLVIVTQDELDQLISEIAGKGSE